MSDLHIPHGAMRRQVVRSKVFNLDNGAAATLDDVLLRHSQPIRLEAARIVYSDATSGTVAAGTLQLGSTVAGAEYIAATNYENTKAVGTKTDLTLTAAAKSVIPAGTPLIARHTGVATTQAGEAYLEVEYLVLG